MFLIAINEGSEGFGPSPPPLRCELDLIGARAQASHERVPSVSHHTLDRVGRCNASFPSALVPRKAIPVASWAVCHCPKRAKSVTPMPRRESCDLGAVRPKQVGSVFGRCLVLFSPS